MAFSEIAKKKLKWFKMASNLFGLTAPQIQSKEINIS